MNPYPVLRDLTVVEQNVAGVVAIIIGVVGSVEVFGFLGEQKWVSPVISRKFTHVSVGSCMLTGMSCFPLGHSWPGRLGISSILMVFLFAFAFLAHMTDQQFAKLPPLLAARVRRLEKACCRTGKRIELMGGTFLYCAVLAQLVVFGWTSPLNVISFSVLIIGDGLADPVGRTFGGGMQYRVGNFGTKSLPGNLACFLGGMAGSLFWGSLFLWAGHWGPAGSFDWGRYVSSAAMCCMAGAVGEAVGPPDADNVTIMLFSNLFGYYLASSGHAPFLVTTLG
mmetsp:Transcript_36974/g.86635  ORF Transcript_36974/g.86635 Transcript_36974/m.86635 type:complete len:280 (-) Transcript_36974:197-1036(-)